MPRDIFLADSGNPIKNGTRLIATGGRGSFSACFQTLNTDVQSKPTIAEIDDKYENRFDDKGYYV